MPKVLMVDDNSEHVRATSVYLTRMGWEFTGVYNGEDALNRIDPSFDAVILDLRMGKGLSGEEVLSEIRKRPELRSVCVIILTGYGDMPTAIACLRKGAHHFLNKDYEPEHLRRLLISGIAVQKAKALPKSLLVTPEAALAEIESIIKKTINPAGLFVIFLKPDGTIKKIAGNSPDIHNVAHPHFVKEIVRTGLPLHEGDPDRVRELQPITSDAQSMLAAPVPAANHGIAGILDIESSTPDAFDTNWEEVVSQLSYLLAISLELVEKQQLMAERKQWKDLPIVLNELKHHISTPTQVISMHAREFKEKDLKLTAETTSQKVLESMSRRITAIEKNADDIKRVCTYLANVSDEIPLDMRQFDVRAILDDCLGEINSELEQKYISLDVSSNREGPVMLCADPMLIRYCLQCLLRNAIEAIEERRSQVRDPQFDAELAGDQIRIQLLENGAPLENGAHKLQVSVEDTGIGISPENSARIFQPLFSTKQRIESGGMGLFSVRRIMNQHDGNVTFESELGKGTKFTLMFPRAEERARVARVG